MLYSISGRQKVLGFYDYLYTVTLAHMWLLNNLSSFVKNVIIVKHTTSAIGKTCPSVVLYCFLKYLRECQFFKEIVIFQKSDPFFVLFQTARTFLILTLHWKAMLFWKCLYPYFNFKWLFDVATEVKILLWYTYFKVESLHNSCIAIRMGFNDIDWSTKFYLAGYILWLFAISYSEFLI